MKKYLFSRMKLGCSQGCKYSFNKEIDIILVKSISRFARNSMDFAIPAIIPQEQWDLVQNMIATRAEKYHIQRKLIPNIPTPYTGFGFCPHCRSYYFNKTNHGEKMLYCTSNKVRKLCSQSESVFIEDLDKIIPLMIKKLKANEPELRKELLKAFDNNDAPLLDKEIADLSVQIDQYRDKMAEYDNYSSEVAIALKEQTRKEINRLIDSKAILENERLIYLKPETRVNEIINELRRMPDAESIGSYDFRHLFKRLIIVNRNRLILVIGSDDMDKIPLNPNAIPMMFVENYSYKVRATKYNCNFGIYINK